MGSNVLHKDRLAYLTMKGWGNEQRTERYDEIINS